MLPSVERLHVVSRSMSKLYPWEQVRKGCMPETLHETPHTVIWLFQIYAATRMEARITRVKRVEAMVVRTERFLGLNGQHH